MVKHTQTIRRQIAEELSEIFDHLVGLALKGLTPETFFKYCKVWWKHFL